VTTSVVLSLASTLSTYGSNGNWVWTLFLSLHDHLPRKDIVVSRDGLTVAPLGILAQLVGDYLSSAEMPPFSLVGISLGDPGIVSFFSLYISRPVARLSIHHKRRNHICVFNGSDCRVPARW